MILRNWLSSWCWLVAIGSILHASTLPQAATNAICDPDQPSHCAKPLKAGEPAPFSGQLLSPELAIDLGLKADFCGKRLDLELKFQKETLELDLDLEKRLRKLDLEAAKTREDLLLKRLEEAQGGHWYESPAVVATVTVVCTVLLIWGARETLKAW